MGKWTARARRRPSLNRKCRCVVLAEGRSSRRRSARRTARCRSTPRASCKWVRTGSSSSTTTTPSALFELALLPDGTLAERIWRRPLVGVAEGQLLDPEGLTGVELDGETFIIAASSLCVRNGNGSGQQRVNDGLVRVRYTPRVNLHAEAMDGFRAWLLTHEPSLVEAGEREPDAGGLNIEGVVWDPRTQALLFGQRGPAETGRIAVVRVPVDAGAAPWETSSLKAPSILRIRIPKSGAAPGIRDISYDEQAGDLPDSARAFEEQRQGTVSAVHLERHQRRGQAPRCHLPPVHEAGGCHNISPDGDQKKILVVDDGGGYAVLDWPNRPR